MDLLVLIILSIVTLRYLDKRSKVAFVAHSVLFAILLFLSLFTTNLPWVANEMSSVCGEEAYVALREALIEPAGAVFSAFYIIIMLEIVYLAYFIARGFLQVYKKIDDFRKNNFKFKKRYRESEFCFSYLFFFQKAYFYSLLQASILIFSVFSVIKYRLRFVWRRKVCFMPLFASRFFVVDKH